MASTPVPRGAGHSQRAAWPTAAQQTCCGASGCSTRISGAPSRSFPAGTCRGTMSAGSSRATPYACRAAATRQNPDTHRIQGVDAGCHSATPQPPRATAFDVGLCAHRIYRKRKWQQPSRNARIAAGGSSAASVVAPSAAAWLRPRSGQVVALAAPAPAPGDPLPPPPSGLGYQCGTRHQCEGQRRRSLRARAQVRRGGRPPHLARRREVGEAFDQIAAMHSGWRKTPAIETQIQKQRSQQRHTAQSGGGVAQPRHQR